MAAIEGMTFDWTFFARKHFDAGYAKSGHGLLQERAERAVAATNIGVGRSFARPFLPRAERREQVALLLDPLQDGRGLEDEKLRLLLFGAPGHFFFGHGCRNGW